MLKLGFNNWAAEQMSDLNKNAILKAGAAGFSRRGVLRFVGAMAALPMPG